VVDPEDVERDGDHGNSSHETEPGHDPADTQRLVD
jgi:hypothetical protein